MASVVDICNLALSHIGDEASVSSIDPPENSAQAQYCARFYPIARDTTIERHTWGFSTSRMVLAQVQNEWSEWDYAYAEPAGAVNIIAVLPPYALDDYSESVSTAFSASGVPSSAGGRYVPQPYSCEINSSGAQVILTDQADAVLRYTRIVEDPTQFSPLFVDAVGFLLASYLAGPIIKGVEGAQMAAAMLKAFREVLKEARESDAGQRRVQPIHNVSWIVGR
ncbi:hypothetical protein [Niveibacterium terrae]|uniref:hypothetical protein n=1 Tax=Niveibacterium terrae TaxID=3373598 RepID=UPI003A95B9E3